ncbi:hypothetical protein ACTZWW_02340 [Salinarimonas sp. NSM]|uniref:hypothetical protein n=1 Tax=Salinarimonas sp. NSM TaxID=3458003 RepID=UPI004036BD6E
MLSSMSPKLIAGAIIVPAVAVFATWSLASNAARPELTTVTQQGCGAPVNFALPLRTSREAAPTVLVTYGPVELTAAEPVSLGFDPTLTAANEVAMNDGALVLPMTFGTDRLSPKAIRVNCRDGAVTSVRYERDRTVRNFNVVRTTPEVVGDPQT